MITLLLADDQALVRGAMAALLGLEEDLEVVAEVGSGDEVVEAARRTRPDVAVLDVEMPGLDGISAAAQLTSELPGTRVLIVTTFGRPGYLRRALDALSRPELDAVERAVLLGPPEDPAARLLAAQLCGEPWPAEREMADAVSPARFHRRGTRPPAR